MSNSHWLIWLGPKKNWVLSPRFQKHVDWKENYDLDLFVFVAAQLLPAAAAATCCPCCPMLTNIALSSSFRGRFEAPTTAGRVCTRTPPLGRFLAICFLRVETISMLAFHSGCMCNSVLIFVKTRMASQVSSQVCAHTRRAPLGLLAITHPTTQVLPGHKWGQTSEFRNGGSGKSCCRKQDEPDIRPKKSTNLIYS